MFSQASLEKRVGALVLRDEIGEAISTRAKLPLSA